MVFLATVPGRADEVFSVLGLDFPVLDETTWPSAEDTVAFAPYPVMVELVFYLSPAGEVDSFIYEPSSSEPYIESVRRSLEGLSFHPAVMRDSAVSFVLPARLRFEKERGRPRAVFHLPYSEPDCRKSPYEIDRALKLSGFDLPGIERLPSYFCRPGSDLGQGRYHFTVIELQIDSAGRLEDYGEVVSSRSDYFRYIRNLLLYADYRPARYRERSFGCRIYLVVRFFDNIRYPTAVWPPDDSVAAFPFELLRVETRLYLDSIISPPFPLNIRNGAYKLYRPAQFKDTVEAVIRVDTNGRIIRADYDNFLIGPQRLVLDEVTAGLRFTPAVRLDNEPTVFDGRLRFILEADEYIRVRCGWLPGVEAGVDG